MTTAPAMTGEDFMREWDYRYAERLGHLCGAAEPSPAQKRLARQDADAAVKAVRDRYALLATFSE